MYQTLYNFAQNNPYPVLGVSLLFAFVYSALTVRNERHHAGIGVKWIFLFMTGIYFVTLYVVTLGSRYVGDATYIHFDLFWSYRRFFDFQESSHLVENTANVIMFLPFGIFAAGRTKGRKHTVFVAILSAVLSSASIEVIQLCTRRGCFDIDDVFHNVFGAFLGMLMYQILKKRFI